MRPGSLLETATTALAPAIRSSVSRSAASKLRPRRSASAISWGITSVSVSLSQVTPAAARRSRSSRWFSTMPFCTTTTSPALEQWGWALRSLGSPCVAQRVCPMPLPPLGITSIEFSSSASLPRRLSTAIAPSRSITAMPALS